MVSWLVWRVSVLILNLFFLFDTRCHKFYGAPTLLAKALSSLAFCLVTINVTACLESHPNGKLPTKSLIVIWTMCLMLIRQHRICVVVAGGGMRERRLHNEAHDNAHHRKPGFEIHSRYDYFILCCYSICVLMRKGIGKMYRSCLFNLIILTMVI